MMKKVKLSEINKEQIWDLEKKVANIAKEVEEDFQHLFLQNSYILEIYFSRNDTNPKHFPYTPKTSKEQCLEPHYCSHIGVSLRGLDGNEIDDDNYEFDLGHQLTIWEVEKTFFIFVVDKFPLFKIRGFILDLPLTQIKRQLTEDILYIAQHLKIENERK